MGNYDNIQVPPPNGPISASQYGVRVRDAIIDLDTRVSIREAAEMLPDVSANSINNVISVTSTAFTDLPSPGPLNLAVTNPSADFDLVVLISYSAWMNATASDCRGGLAASGGLSFTPNSFGTGGAITNSDNLFTASPNTSMQHNMLPVVIPAGAATVTFKLWAMRGAASGAQAFNYPILRATPLRFQVP